MKEKFKCQFCGNTTIFKSNINVDYTDYSAYGSLECCACGAKYSVRYPIPKIVEIQNKGRFGE